jgi:hypothetical protein
MSRREGVAVMPVPAVVTAALILRRRVVRRRRGP